MSGPSRVYSMWLPVDLVDRVDTRAASAGMSRNAYVKGVLESATGPGGGSDPLGDHGANGVVVE
jgi:hypothetical protein